MSTPSIANVSALAYEAAASAYWYKNSLQVFLVGVGIPSSAVQFRDGETKRALLSRLFGQLSESESGRSKINDIARSLCEMDAFPDLKNHEDSKAKLEHAQSAISELRKCLDRQTTSARKEEEAAQRRMKAQQVKEGLRLKELTLEKLKDRLEQLSTRIGESKAGIEFETWLYDVFQYFDLEACKPFKVGERQRDGSVTIEGTTYIVEAKFTAGKTPPAQIDSLTAKVNLGADNTMGVFFSIGGYTSGAVRAASVAGTKILLFDSAHLYGFLVGGLDLSEIVKRVRRHASNTGEAFLPIHEFSK